MNPGAAETWRQGCSEAGVLVDRVFVCWGLAVPGTPLATTTTVTVTGPVEDGPQGVPGTTRRCTSPGSSLVHRGGSTPGPG